MYKYPVDLTPDEEGGFVVTFPDVPEAITQGEDLEDALLHGRGALETALSFYVDGKRDVPIPSAAGGRPTVSPDALECAKLDIYRAMREQGISKAELARRLHWHGPQVDRLLDLTHRSQFLSIELVAASLGKEVEMRVV